MQKKPKDRSEQIAKPLQLHRETLVLLESGKLREVAGEAPTLSRCVQYCD